MYYINSHNYLKSLLFALSAMNRECNKINAMNVFPVPDGDTGSNMTMTLQGVKSVRINDDTKPFECATKAANLMLRSARGNSGVILSVFFRGVARKLTDLNNEASGDNKDTSGNVLSRDIAAAFAYGAECAYSAVMKPTEGTILTVMRSAAEKALLVTKDQNVDMSILFNQMLEAARDALAKTPEQLPLLKSAGVVDAGGCGFVTILSAMATVMSGGGDITELEEVEEITPAASLSAAAASDAVITFPYCTECIVEKDEEHVGDETAAELRDYVYSAGDSVVFVDDNEIIKLHVHTSSPGNVLSEAMKYGSFISVKIENMRKQHSELLEEPSALGNSIPTEFKKNYGFVAVANGSGIGTAFRDLGVDRIVAGGQTMNPSTESLLEAVRYTGAENVFILPNNSNIILVAEQAAQMARDMGINAVVIPSKSIPQGIWALYTFASEASCAANAEAMAEALSGVRSFSVTRAVRDAEIGELSISEGEFMGLCENKVAVNAPSISECIEKMMRGRNDISYMIVFGGEGKSDHEGTEIVKLIKKTIGNNTEITYVKGDQPVYDYIIAAE